MTVGSFEKNMGLVALLHQSNKDMIFLGTIMSNSRGKFEGKEYEIFTLKYHYTLMPLRGSLVLNQGWAPDKNALRTSNLCSSTMPHQISCIENDD